MSFEKWAIFCLDRDYENAKYIQESFYNLSEKYRLNIYVEYANIISLRDNAQIDDFREAIDQYFSQYVNPSQSQGYKKGQKPMSPESKKYFYLVIIPDKCR